MTDSTENAAGGRTEYDDLWTSAWGEIQRIGPVHRHVHEHFVKIVDALDVRSILDVGCGSGDILALLAARGRYDLAGVDVSERALELAHRRAPDAQMGVLDIQREALEEKFDLVVSIGVVEHLLDDLAAFRNMASMASRYVLISTISGRMRPSEIPIGHVRNYSRLELARKLQSAGLDVVWVRGWGFPFYSPLVRTIGEWLPGGPPTGELGPLGHVVARALYAVYMLNIPGRGDMLWVLARPTS